MDGARFKETNETWETEEKGLPEGYFLGEDGRLRVKKTATYMAGGIFDTLIPAGEASFPCMEEDGDSYLSFVALFGIFGLHKLREKNYFLFLIYLFTFGVGGFCYAADVLFILLGQYTAWERTEGGKRQRVFSAPVTDKKRGMIFLAASAGIAIFMAWIVRPRIMSFLGTLFFWAAMH